MRLRRLVLSTVAIGLVSTGATSYAAVKKPPAPVCNLIKDQPGDGRSTAVPVLTSPALDIISGDVATGKKTVKVVLRLKSTNVSGDNVALLGMKWVLNFEAQGVKYSVSRQRTSGTAGTYTDRFSVSGSATTPKDMKVTQDGTSITWVLPRALVPGLKKPRTVITNLAASTFVYTNNADAASSTAKYPDLYPSCTKPA